MFCKHCGKSIVDDSSFCSYCGGVVNDEFIETKESSFYISDYESETDVVDHEEQQNVYGQQQETIQRIEKSISSNRKSILILLLIMLGLFCIGFLLAYNQHEFWFYLCLLV